MVNCSEPHHGFECGHLVSRKIFDQTEVEKGDLASTVEEVVPGMRIAVERAHRVEAPEYKSEHGFGNRIAFVLVPREHVRPRVAAHEFGGEDSARAKLGYNFWNRDSGMSAIKVSEPLLILRFAVCNRALR